MRILACVDASPYAKSVCDYAGWLAGAFDQDISLLHAIESAVDGSPADAEDILSDAASILRNNGVKNFREISQRGEFADVAVALSGSHSVLVVGKRGAGDLCKRLSLGSSIQPILRQTERPVFLSPSLFLPISRALVLLDADITHRSATKFVRDHPWLTKLDTDVVVMTDGNGGQDKLEWARSLLGETGVDIFPLSADGHHDALERYRQMHPIDLLVVSREVLLPDLTGPLGHVDAGSLWAWRAPVLIC